MSTITGDIDLTPYEQLTDLADQIGKTATWADPKPKYMPTTDDVKHVLRERMAEQGLTVNDLADRTGADTDTVRRLLRDGYSTFDVAKPIFALLHVDPFVLPPEFATADLEQRAAQS